MTKTQSILRKLGKVVIFILAVPFVMTFLIIPPFGILLPFMKAQDYCEFFGGYTYLGFGI